ncbi:hypothetical protein J7I85_01035 [Arthrobacter sp. ISL-65]|nr:hypothetical protein [Arthrobacter sp. ISL-65]
MSPSKPTNDHPPRAIEIDSKPAILVLTAWVLLLGVFICIVLNADDPGVPMLMMLMLVGEWVED